MSGKNGPASSINSWDADYILAQYETWRENPSSVSAEWQTFFRGFELGRVQVEPPRVDNGKVIDDVSAGTATFRRPAGANGDDECEYERLQSRVDSLVYHYRDLGHLIAQLDPLGRNREEHPLLALEAFDLNDAHLEMAFHGDRFFWGGSRMKLSEILDGLKRTYCSSIGVEYMHIQNTPERRWLQRTMEPSLNQPQLSAEQKLHIARMLRRAEAFERFLQTNYIGQKRFSLEGGETLIPLVDTILLESATRQISEIVLGMAHRGRLNVLANILQKSYEEVFSEFEDNYEPGMVFGDGDVKYHKGYSSDWTTYDGKCVHVTLTANPSHLEAVNPVVVGRVRAKQRRIADADRNRVLGLMLHGDAAFAGQGIVAETLNLSQLKGYRTGGSIHIIVNNQIGFTTLPEDARSGHYCTDVAKMIQAPIFHVNGDDPEAVVHVARMAVEYRQLFQKDVVIDMYCYRRLGHNEGDDPAFTQPKMYELIRARDSVYEIYRKKLIDEGVVGAAALDEMAHELDKSLADAQARVRNATVISNYKPFRADWADFQHEYSHEPVHTKASDDLLAQVAEVWNRVPDNFELNRKIKRVLEKRYKAVKSGAGIDWATGEGLAFGTLLLEGTPVRLSGQDSRRGTFSHRHAAVWDVNTAEIHVPLNTIREDQARFCVYDSPLSEAAVLGFDYGYSLGNPDMLICWEAQFGDFANGAQTIIDQFIATGESKWNRSSGIVLLLPHGYEGQGPEHSSGWIERFLQLFAENNLQVCNMTTPAQYFHVLRRQMMRNFRKPLVIAAPKSLLRHPQAVSKIEDFQTGCFREVLPDSLDPEKVTRVVLCSGKVYYELLAERGERELDDVALVRLEQYAPFPEEQLAEVLASYRNARELAWCQEEPANKGAWTFLRPHLQRTAGHLPLFYVGRPAASSPATGHLKRHQHEQNLIVSEALSSPDEPTEITQPATTVAQTG